jgi:hypothetical protein
LGDYIDVRQMKDETSTESYFNTSSTLETYPYHFAKAQAEQEAWQMARHMPSNRNRLPESEPLAHLLMDLCTDPAPLVQRSRQPKHLDTFNAPIERDPRHHLIARVTAEREDYMLTHYAGSVANQRVQELRRTHAIGSLRTCGRA